MTHCGIDFGTSNTTLSILDGDTPRLVPLEHHKDTIPSALFFPADRSLPLFGRAAIHAYLNGEEGRFMRSLKRVLGTSIMQSGTTIHGKRFTFPVLIGLFLRHIKDTAEQQTGQTLKSVTLGRPVHFQNHNPEADAKAENELRAIAQDIGFDTIRFQYEPIAGALAHERHITQEQLALVIDIGGGTSDFSVIRLSPHHKAGQDRSNDILANSGIRIGGNDCDKAINLHSAMPLFGMGDQYGDKNLEIPSSLYFDLSEWSKIMLSYTPQNKTWVRQLISLAHNPEKIMLLEQILDEELAHRILNTSEMAKITLSEDPRAYMDYDFIQKGLNTHLSQEMMNSLFEKTLNPVIDALYLCLERAHVSPSDISTLILTGGSTSLPFFRNIWQSIFPHATLQDEDKLGSVGTGLCLS
jgi:hypothetical chaperone protein